VAKSNKFSSKVPALEDYKPSWVNADGEVDVDAALKAAHTLMLDKAKAQDAREDAVAETKEAQSQATELQEKLDSKNDPDTKAELEKARTKQAEAEAKATKAELRADRIEIAAEKGLSPAQAKRLVGDNREELEADADELVKDLGIEPGKKTEDDGEEDEGRTTPRAKLRTAGDPVSGGTGGDQPVDFEAEAAKIQGNRPW
jgi:hypothetical protein